MNNITTFPEKSPTVNSKNHAGLTLDELDAQTDKRPQPWIIEPWLTEGQLCLLYAKRGIGKSWIALQLAHAIASGSSIGDWSGKGHPVVYLDGEMGSRAILSRYRHILSASKAVDKPGHMTFWTMDQCGGVFWNLSSDEGKKAIWPIIKPASIVIIDNLMTVATRMDQFDTPMKIWERLQRWFIQLRARGKTVILLHHTNKTEDKQSGSTDKENIQDLILKLDTCQTEPDHKGAKFVLEFEKTRSIHTPDPSVWLLQDSGEWKIKSVEESIRDHVTHLRAKDWKDPDICKKLSISKSHLNEIMGEETPLPSPRKKKPKQIPLLGDDDNF